MFRRVCNDSVSRVCLATAPGHQEEIDGTVGSREVRGPAPYGTMASMLPLQRWREHLELRDTFPDQEIRGEL